MRCFLTLLVVVLVACGPEATPDQAFCSRAVSLLSQGHNLEQLEESVRAQMDQLRQMAATLPDDEEEPLLLLIDGLSKQMQRHPADGWSSFEVVDYVASLCGSDDLTWAAVTP